MTILEEICAKKRKHIEKQKAETSLEALKEQVKQNASPRGFIKHLKQKSPTAIIAEVKKASPSKGTIAEDFAPETIAKTYEESGAACISVLTDTPYFQGRDKDLTAVIQATSLPILRKDFMIDPYQIYESRALGADCILIIMAALDDEQAQHLYQLAQDLGMDVLVEIHDAPELDRALKLNPELLGINNRNLKTLDVSIETSFNLIDRIPSDILKISESGLRTIEEITALQQAGFQGFLIGETLMREKNVKKTLQKWLTQSVN